MVFPKEGDVGHGRHLYYEQTELEKLAGDLTTGFSYQGEWTEVRMTPEYGVLYRICTKDDIRDREGDPADLTLCFAVPFANKGRGLTDAEQTHVYGTLQQVIEMSTCIFQAKTGRNIIAGIMPPPPKMLDELKKQIG